MQKASTQTAEARLAEAVTHLNKVRHLTRMRYLEGRANERDLEVLMRADAEAERAAANLERLTSGGSG